ncbi:hypothetical protein OG988_15505 [Streptomyces zaomyceticus]|uniref:NACHT domain-containing protein n=1 Tax=Streptomyces zaomyceticus TaxID=68286 RepID=A0ABZ1L8B5_9ACTN
MAGAGGERPVTVDNEAGVVVIGDGNQVGFGTGTGVRSAYREQVRRIAPPELVGREEELAELAAFCRTGDGYRWWRADAWAGKTALMAWFALHPPAGVRVVPFFVTARLGAQNDVVAYVDVVLEQLTELAGEGLPALLTAATREAHLLRLYASAAEACARRGERLVLLVDGLDEDRGVTTGPDARSIVSLLPLDLPVIVSGRLNPPLPADVPEDHPLRNPATVRLLPTSPKARAIRAEAERELKHFIAAGGLPYELLALLTAAGGGLTADDLAELTGAVPYRVRDVLRTGPGRTFAVRGAAYLLAHEELVVGAREMLGQRELDRHRDRLHTWADEWRLRRWPDASPDYLLHGYAPMLRSAGALDRAVEWALDGARHDRLLERTGGDLAALGEIEAAEAALVDAGMPDLLRTVRLVIAREELVDRSDRIPPTLPWAWAVLGRYGRAEGLARSIPSPDRRARALVDVALGLHGAGETAEAVTLLDAAHDAAARCGNVFDDEGDRALAAVSRAWARVGLLDRAADTAVLVTDPWARAGLLSEVSRAWWTEGEPERALALGRVEPDGSARGRVLAVSAAAHAARGDVTEAVRLAAEAGPEGEVLPLVRVAEVLLRAGDDRAAAVLDRVDALVGVEHVLGGVVEALAEAGEYERAVAAALLPTTAQARGRALADVVGVLVAAGRIDAAHALAETIEDPEARGAALVGIVAALAVTHGPGAVESTAALVEDEWARERALSVLVDALAEAGEFDRAEALARDGAPWRTLSRDPLGSVVEALARSGRVERARALAPEVPDGDGGFALVRGVVTACAEDGAGPGALSAAAEIVAEVEERVRAESRGGTLDVVHTARALAEAGFTDLARGLLRDVEDRVGPLADLHGTALIGRQVQAGTAVEALARAGEYDRAEALLRGITTMTTRYMAVTALVRQLFEEGLSGRAEALVEGVAGVGGREGLWVLLAEEAATRGRGAVAEGYARRVSRVGDRARVWAAAAGAHARAGDAERAEGCLAQVGQGGGDPLLVVPATVGVLLARGDGGAVDALLADALDRAGTGTVADSGRLEETVRTLVAVGDPDRATAFVRALAARDGGANRDPWFALVTALADGGEHARAAAEVRRVGLPGESVDTGTAVRWGRVARVVEPEHGRILLARLLRVYRLVDLLPVLLRLEPATAPLVFEACVSRSAPLG